LITIAGGGCSAFNISSTYLKRKMALDFLFPTPMCDLKAFPAPSRGDLSGVGMGSPMSSSRCARLGLGRGLANSRPMFGDGAEQSTVWHAPPEDGDCDKQLLSSHWHSAHEPCEGRRRSFRMVFLHSPNCHLRSYPHSGQDRCNHHVPHLRWPLAPPCSLPPRRAGVGGRGHKSAPCARP
jgi:hypothetical protein